MTGSGVSTFDLLGDIPPEQRTLMRLFMRRIKLTAAELTQAVAELPLEKQLTAQQIKDTLARLIESSWVARVEENGQEVFTIHQQSKSS